MDFQLKKQTLFSVFATMTRNLKTFIETCLLFKQFLNKISVAIL